MLRIHVPEHNMEELGILMSILISSLYAYYENDAWRIQEI